MEVQDYFNMANVLELTDGKTKKDSFALEHPNFHDFQTITETVPSFSRKSGLPKPFEADPFVVNPFGLLRIRIIQGDMIPFLVCNHIPYIQNQIQVHSLDAQATRKVTIGIYRDGLKYRAVTVNCSAIANSKWIDDYFGLGFSYENGESYKAINDFLQKIANRVPAIHQYQYLGWATDNSWTYTHAKGVISEEKQTNITVTDELSNFALMPNRKIKDIDALKFLKSTIFEIMPNSLTKIMFSFMLLSLTMSKLTDEQPEFVLIVHGPTGSYKTSISKIMFNIHKAYYNKAPMNITVTTLAAMEIIGMQLRDTVCLYDDVSPTNNKVSKQTIMKNIDTLIRSTGDSTGRQKMHGSSKRTMKPGGLSAVTAEYVPLENQSSLARCLLIPVQEEKVNLKKLTKAQDKRDIYPTVITNYICYIASMKEQYVERLMTYFKQECENFKALSDIHGRLPYTAAWIFASYRLFLEYMESIDKSLVVDMDNNQFLDDLLLLMYDHKQYIKGQDDVNIFRSVVKDLLQTEKSLGVIQYDTDKSKIAEISPKTIGYIDDKYIYLMPDVAFNAVSGFLGKQGKTFPTTMVSLKNNLKERGFLKTNNGKKKEFTVKIIINKKRIRVLCIKRKFLYK